MRNFRKFDGDARRFLMAVLFAMPLCSAADLARLNTYSRAYVGKMLPVLEAEGLVFREKAGHAHGRVWRWALTGAGVAFVSSECDVTPGWPHSNEGLHYLRLRMDLVETTYRVVPGLFQDFAETIRFQGTFFLVAQGYWDMDEPVPVPVSEEYRLAGFQWGLAPQFDAVAEYEVTEPMSKLDATIDKTTRVQIPVVRWGSTQSRPWSRIPSSRISSRSPATLKQWGFRVFDTLLGTPANPIFRVSDSSCAQRP